MSIDAQQTDAELVAAALRGDIEAFCGLARRYQDHVYGVALGVVADFHLALDAAQEALLCAWCDLPKLRDRGRFGAWLCGIARNTALEIRRDRQRQSDLALEAASAFSAAAAPPSDANLQRQEQQALVRAALLRVQPKDREALTLYYADGLSYSQICGFAGITTGALKGRLQRGKAALRKELTMVRQTCRDNAPDDAFIRRLREAIEVFTAKGPATNQIPSAWHSAIHNQTGGLLSQGEMGLRVDTALSHSGSRRQRWFAVIHLGLRRDERSGAELMRMLVDRSPRIRAHALKWWAQRLRRDGVAGEAALALLLERLADENFNVRLAAVQMLAPHAHANQPIAAALTKSLDDPKHKVRHAAAKALGVACRGCGKRWDPPSP
jgi:RNA polymerase sigma-70 factor (ECF subfamily)